jgi:hypothetical protein
MWEFSKQNNNRLHETVYRKQEIADDIVFIKRVVVNGFHVEDGEFEKFLKDYLDKFK